MKQRLLRVFSLLMVLLAGYGSAEAQATVAEDSVFIRKIFDAALSEGRSYEWLRHLTKTIGPRFSGSPGAEKAVEYTAGLMKSEAFDHVFLQDVMVPHWVRGPREKAAILVNGKRLPVPLAALGGSIATRTGGVTAQVIEVRSFQELRQLGKARVQGRIVFFNRPMDSRPLSTFNGYIGAVDQRASGASEAGKLGAVGAIIRSVTTRIDDFPHTGSMRYAPGAPMIPAAAISTAAAELLSKTLATHPELQFYFEQDCRTLPDARSHNVIGELKGSEKPEAYLVAGGHLDSWDIAEGAHDDGAGCVQAIEALRLLKVLGYKPRHTLRAVMFMNEENGLRGGITYADSAKAKNEKHIAAIESDRGGFRPLGFGIVGKESQKSHIMQWQSLFSVYGIHELGVGGGGADIGPLAPSGTVLLGLIPDSQRYFDYHHAASDTFETVNKRELELGGAAMAAMLYLLDKYGPGE